MAYKHKHLVQQYSLEQVYHHMRNRRLIYGTNLVWTLLSFSSLILCKSDYYVKTCFS
jgi:hypothetical protein